MPKIRASMADVSSEYTPVEPGIHRYEIEDCEEKVNTDSGVERVHYVLTNRIVKVLEDGDEKDVGRKVNVRIHIHTKKGELNEIGLAQLKRFFEVTVGDERANDPEADTDELKGQQFVGKTIIRGYKSRDEITGEETERRTNEIQSIASIDDV